MVRDMTHIKQTLLFFTSYVFAVNASGKSCSTILISFLTNHCHSHTIDSSSDSVCPRDTVVFTCTTDTGELTWKIGGLTAFFTSISESNHVKLSVYDLN